MARGVGERSGGPLARRTPSGPRGRRRSPSARRTGSGSAGSRPVPAPDGMTVVPGISRCPPVLSATAVAAAIGTARGRRASGSRAAPRAASRRWRRAGGRAGRLPGRYGNACPFAAAPGPAARAPHRRSPRGAARPGSRRCPPAPWRAPDRRRPGWRRRGGTPPGPGRVAPFIRATMASAGSAFPAVRRGSGSARLSRRHRSIWRTEQRAG